jgi:uncharacterized protein DUF4145
LLMINTASKLIHLQNRILALEKLADEVEVLAKKLLIAGSIVQPELANKGQRWYRGARELLVQQGSSGLEEFENCYQWYERRGSKEIVFRAHTDIERIINLKTCQKEEYDLFEQLFRKARSIIQSTDEEVLSRELPVVTQLSFELVANEFDAAQELLNQGGKIDSLIRASGVIARVALERHLHTVINNRNLKVLLNPPTKKKADISDLSNTLVKENVITAIQRSELDGLFMIGNHCAHPNETATFEDVKRLLERAKDLAASIL